MPPHLEDPPRTRTYPWFLIAATLCRSLEVIEGEARHYLNGPAAFPPEHVACGTRRRILVLENERKPSDGGEAGAKRAEGEIKGCVFLEVKSLARLGVSLDTTVCGYPQTRVSTGTAYSFFVAVIADA
jgi:hypothetical protein